MRHPDRQPGRDRPRVIRTAHRLGHETVAVYARPRRHAPTSSAKPTRSFRLGPADLAESYLSVERLLEAIGATGADAVHPGLRLPGGERRLRQSRDRGRLRSGSGHTPLPSSRMGSKIEARRIAARCRRADHPRLRRVAGPGRPRGRRRPHRLTRCSSRPPPAVVARASASSHSPDEFAAALARGIDRGRALLRRRRHDRRALHPATAPRRGPDRRRPARHRLHLGTRECSVQRRYQKVLEEAPAPNLPDATRDGLHAAAVQLAIAMEYDSAGTVEFIVDDDDRRLLLPRDEHPAPGRAPGDRGGHRPRHRRTHDPRRPTANRCRWHRTTSRSPVMRSRPDQCRGPGQRIRPADRHDLPGRSSPATSAGTVRRGQR